MADEEMIITSIRIKRSTWFAAKKKALELEMNIGEYAGKVIEDAVFQKEKT